jgi:hypothetical protein
MMMKEISFPNFYFYFLALFWYNFNSRSSQPPAILKPTQGNQIGTEYSKG